MEFAVVSGLPALLMIVVVLGSVEPCFVALLSHVSLSMSVVVVVVLLPVDRCKMTSLPLLAFVSLVPVAAAPKWMIAVVIATAVLSDWRSALLRSIFALLPQSCVQSIQSLAVTVCGLFFGMPVALTLDAVCLHAVSWSCVDHAAESKLDCGCQRIGPAPLRCCWKCSSVFSVSALASASFCYLLATVLLQAAC